MREFLACLFWWGFNISTVKLGYNELGYNELGYNEHLVIMNEYFGPKSPFST